MGDIHYVKDLPWESYFVLDDPRRIVIEQSVFNRLGRYDTSTPTAPSAGRIYRRNLLWFAPNKEPDWIVYVVMNDPSDIKYQLHHPHLVELVADPVAVPC